MYDSIQVQEIIVYVCMGIIYICGCGFIVFILNKENKKNKMICGLLAFMCVVAFTICLYNVAQRKQRLDAEPTEWKVIESYHLKPFDLNNKKQCDYDNYFKKSSSGEFQYLTETDKGDEMKKISLGRDDRIFRKRNNQDNIVLNVLEKQYKDARLQKTHPYKNEGLLGVVQKQEKAYQIVIPNACN
ncbi:hypothetical protein P9D51_10835 [Bacillus sonorensis]|uniref:hypothetical protein n=1 Tax=Bacillus sonorensis TaxID=119858 RepID=UPI002DBDCC18|nr:hypothetical protein [Bacillus sonorensis]MEC1426601.1 hypothetical protein [Bacillus sonorensis]